MTLTEDLFKYPHPVYLEGETRRGYTDPTTKEWVPAAEAAPTAIKASIKFGPLTKEKLDKNLRTEEGEIRIQPLDGTVLKSGDHIIVAEDAGETKTQRYLICGIVHNAAWMGQFEPALGGSVYKATREDV